jgi:hypothetical protein
VLLQRLFGAAKPNETADLNGNYLNEYYLPVNLNMQRGKGPRNGVLEGITFDKTTQRYTQISKSLCMKMMPKRPRQKAV